MERLKKHLFVSVSVGPVVLYDGTEILVWVIWARAGEGIFIEGGVVDGDFSGAGVLKGVRTATGAVDEAVEGVFSFFAGFECGFSLFLGGSIKPVTCSR